MDNETAALAISEIVDETMSNAAEFILLSKVMKLQIELLLHLVGQHLYITRVAENLRVNTVIIPTNASVGSAVGFLKAPVGYEVVKSLRMLLNVFQAEKVNDLLKKMRNEAEKIIQNNSGKGSFVEERYAFMRYAGQGHEIKVAIDNSDLSNEHSENKICI